MSWIIYSTTLMAGATLTLAIVTAISIWLTQKHNKKVDKYNEETLEVMRKSHEPVLSLDLWKSWKKGHEPTSTTSYTYWITVRNDGMGPARNVEVQYRFGRMHIKSGKEWKESEKDFDLQGISLPMGSIATGGMLEGRLLDTKENSSDLDSRYAVRLKASYEDVFGKKYYEVEQTVHLEDAEER